MPERINLRAFAADRHGSTAIMFGLVISGVIGLAGAAVDGARLYAGRQEHARAIDAGLLAGAKRMQADPGNAAGAVEGAEQLYKSNIKNKDGFKTNTIQFMVGDSASAMTFTGKATISTTFLNVLGISEMQVSAPAKAVFLSDLSRGSDLEIAVMLDVTGSMCDGTVQPCTTGVKLSGMKQAATDLATIVLGNSGTGKSVRMGLVPFATRVRVAVDGDNNNPMLRAMTNMPAEWSGYYRDCIGWTGSTLAGSEVGTGSCASTPVNYKNSWKLMPCVTERAFNSGNPFNASDDAPASSRWLNGHDGTRRAVSDDSSDTAMTSGKGLTADDPMDSWNYNPDGSCGGPANGNVILPLTSKLKDVTDRIATLEAEGGTGGALGTAFVQYMLSPNWGSVWGGTSRPGSYADLKPAVAGGAPKLRKVAVLMTDGAYNAFRSWEFQDQQTVSDYAQSVCTNMKSNGVEIYTIGFNLDALTPGERVIATKALQDCGTDISHFYATITVEDLKTAFRDIALKVTPIRLTQ